ncbi:MAG: shikimate kinase [Devosia sp.]
MESSPTHIEVRRSWLKDETVLLLGPGGVGKSTLGRELARQLGWPLVDLDLEFCERLAIIGDFIAVHGYERYRSANLALAQDLLASVSGPLIFVTSSGFLAAQPETEDYRRSRQLVATGYGVTLLPSLDVDIATSIVVQRQLGRGFGFVRETEDRKFRDRFDIYRDQGDALVVSSEAPAIAASAVIEATGMGLAALSRELLG